ncbi:toluene monooxygenase system ferredoxin subunit [Nocardia transvalensis]|uniref:Toluene monooxygenase system ferredoxin subunit n=1 Tax=Nocardia transvalensis TaxID=37333 RepID=A0A7W9PID2_9NOCA|nr:Rieske 2Fe-2S domain-containing protein [Nocardia transvalensis]MBB5916617.1 toluene monooxygenase system ferredoxin subunit [Nocardia transvalensis]
MTENGTETRNWQETQHIDDLWEDEMVGVEVDGKKVLLVNAGGEVRAYENRCPHQAWPLDEGDLDGGQLTCVNHMWTFDALTGAGINPCDHALKAFPCRVDVDGMIEVDLG